MNAIKPVNIYDIAREAGVSVATVSRVMTKSAKVSKEKRERVEELIEKYEFKPNALAKGLSETKSKIIGVLVSDIRNPFYASLFVECERAASELGYMVLLCNSLGDNSVEERHLENLLSRRVDAIIQIGGRVDELVSSTDYVDRINRVANTIPVIITGRLDGADCYQVNINEAMCMQFLMEYLINLGHRRIAFIGGRMDVKGTVEKRSRYKQMLQRFGIPYREELVLESKHYDDLGGYQCMQKLFELDQLPTAVITINDFAAIGVMKSLNEHGVRIPDDISVASFDNTFLSEVTIPKLTSVSYNYTKYGQAIIQIADEAIRNQNAARITMIEPELVIKESCASVPLTEPE